MKNIELLAPAGDLERLKIAFHYGADAVYIGGRDFSLRANAKNFSLEEIKEAVEYAHNINKKVYVAVNIVFHNSDLEGLDEYLKNLKEYNVDAVIASDIVVVKKATSIGLEVHLSTQASTMNYESANFWKKIGVTRIVLARECNRDNIKRIKNETNLELEAFVHGAICTSISGKCVLSNYCTNRDSNRGGCAQICRWTFDIDNTDETFSITPKDLNMIENIKDMINIGVNSFKIEGRMRSIYYIATVILTYRKIINKIMDGTITEGYLKYSLNILNRCANRDSVPQFYNKLPGEEEQYFLGRDELSNQDFLGIVLDYNEYTKEVTLEQRNYFKIGDEVQFFGPNMATFNYTINSILNENNENIDVARHPRMIVKFFVDQKLSKGDMMRIKVFDKKDFL